MKHLLKLAKAKGNEALEKKVFFFFSKARKYGEEIKIKKKKLKFLELNGGEWSVFDVINAVNN